MLPGTIDRSIQVLSPGGGVSRLPWRPRSPGPRAESIAAPVAILCILQVTLLVTLLSSASWARDCLYYEYYDAQGIDPPLVGATTFADSALALDVQAGHAYVAARSAGLQVIELSDPEAPLTVGDLSWSETATNIVVEGALAFVTTAHRLRVIDIIFAHDPVEILSIILSSPARHLTRGDTSLPDMFLFASLADGTLEIIELDDPTFPRIIGHLEAQGEIRASDKLASHAYLATSAGLEVADISVPETPTLVGTGLPADPALAVAARGDSVYLTTESGELLVAGITDPASPELAGSTQLPGPAFDIALEGPEVYLTSGDGQVWVMRLDLPGSVRWLGGANTPGQALRLDRVGPHLYVADGTGGLQVLWPQCEAVDAVMPGGKPDDRGHINAEGRPGRPTLASVHPNPFNPVTTFSYWLPRSMPCRLAIHDTRGRVVRVLVDRQQAAGEHQTTWRGRDSRGRSVPAGVYVARLETEGGTATRKLLLAR